MKTNQDSDRFWMAMRLALLGAAGGGLIGVLLALPGWQFGMLLAQPGWQFGMLASTLIFVGNGAVVGGALGAAAGTVLKGGYRKEFRAVVVALGVVGIPVMAMVRDIGASAAVLIAAAVLTVAFGIWVLLNAAMHTWQGRQAGRK